MENIKIDDIIPFFAFGAVSVVATFFTFYFYYVKDHVLKLYRNYLWMVWLYLVLNQFFLDSKFSKTPEIIYLFCQMSYWIGNFLYINFLYSASNFKNLKKFPANAKNITLLFIILLWVIHLSINLIFVEYLPYFGFIISPFLIYFFILFIYFIIEFRRKRVMIYYKYLYIGSVLFHLFNTISSFLNPPDDIFGLTDPSILSIGWILEITTFLIALCVKIKYDYDEKIEVIQKNNQHIKRILLQEIEQQNVINKSKNLERQKISSELHDGISNTITGLKFYINDKKIQTTSLEEKELLANVELEIGSLYAQIRNYIQKLYVDDQENTYDVIEFLENLRERYKASLLEIAVHIDKEGIYKKLTNYQRNEFYYILNECIGNVIKHSEAQKVTINIFFTVDLCCFSVEDNGKGFSFDKQLNTGIGLSSIFHRIKKLGGSIEYQCEKGTIIKGNFPYFID